MAIVRSKEKIAAYFLRSGIAFVFLYAGISSLLSPESWIGYMPAFIQKFIPGNTVLLLFLIYELLISIWLISGIMTFEASASAAITLAIIVLFNLEDLNILFRDIAIILSAVSLCILTKKQRNGLISE